MRIFGLALMIVGIVFEVLLLLALLGGGKDLVLGMLISAGLIVTGWKLRTYGQGISQQQSAAASEVSPEAQPPHSPTVEMPVTQAISAAFIRQVARWRRITAIIIACGMAFFLVPAVGIYLAMSSPLSHISFPIILAATALFFGLIVGVIHVFQREIPVRRDLRDATYLRTVGPVQVVSLYGGSLLRLADRAFLAEPPPAKVLRNLTWATVDYSRHAHVIFEIRDQTGRVVYSADRPIT
ncbi:MAG TPA: hypothetical protein VK463_20710 [Desulfomonilaceae bacterium]|nr:hypothetical protein [Desulfomonilaceae bacterium]